MPAPVSRSVPGAVPRGACDCHVHVIGPKARFPLAARRGYTPLDAPLEALVASQDALGLDRVVLVQTSIFGMDNACLLDGLARLGPARGRGVAVPAHDIAGSELDRWHALGVRGVRLNLTSNGVSDHDAILAEIAVAARLCARNGWHIQFFLPPPAYAALEPVLAALPVPVVLDHFAMLRPDGTYEREEPAILRLLGGGNCWVKLSGSYRISEASAGPDLAQLARQLYAANPRRAVWGSDWPHTPAHSNAPGAPGEERPYRDLDTSALLGAVFDWFPAVDARAILVDNAALLYDFS